jgi:glycine dehydrogenase subunit 2
VNTPLLIEQSVKGRRGYYYPKTDVPSYPPLPANLQRESAPQLPEISELDVVRHYTRLATKSFGVDIGFYPLGSCTMKYNPRLHSYITSWDSLTEVHPLQDESTIQGSLELLYNLTKDLSSITGMSWGTMQPLAGAHGEYTGLKIIKAYHQSRNDHKRTKVLIPVSAHGTNPATASVTGFSIVEVATDTRGLVDLESLKSLLDDEVAAIMLTNPNTLGLFESDIREIAHLVHGCGAQLYYDGANLNAIMGISRPGDMGFDVIHLNVHKTLSTPHGGGGPGAGPVLVKEHLQPFLPTPDITHNDGYYSFEWDRIQSIGKVSGFWGNFLVLVKAYTYILTMGSDGLKSASEHAVLNANYLFTLLKGAFDVPHESRCMHEFVVSAQHYKEKYGVKALDFSKALLDRNYHPPTMYFPLNVSEALMFEPPESESVEVLEEFASTMIELTELAKTNADVLRLSPHSTAVKRLDEVKAAKHPILTWREL